MLHARRRAMRCWKRRQPNKVGEACKEAAKSHILELNGMEVLDSDDIRRVLERRFDGEEVRVKVLTGSGEEEILVWSPR